MKSKNSKEKEGERHGEQGERWRGKKRERRTIKKESEWFLMFIMCSVRCTPLCDKAVTIETIIS